ncbi:SPW repeat-containing protein [Tamaricihabitans halophyticus]|uniref:SPW repeat-containing protein n=1 Tax=Tamaricihabitans halophyticus TaxID=1262583 RepID=A0A4R2QH67_9PSEU|nr:SPW repeat protein [Tamaricihabitans halophyticus]TCP48602.1 SPW repeat-containing protein [Tamaricihabitans halophyticus]
MSDLSTRSWTRWQDWGEVVLGVVVALTPLWFDTSTGAMWTMVILGALVALDGLASLAMPGMVYAEWFQMVLGALLFISPWVLTYTDMTGAAWTSWIGGALIVLAGAAALPAATSAHGRTAGQH